MQNKEGIFSLPELSQLKDFCDNCAKEDRKIYEQRKKNSSFIPEDKKPEAIKKTNINSYNNNKNNNKYKENIKVKSAYNNSNNNINNKSQGQQNKSRMNPDTFKRRLKMFES